VETEKVEIKNFLASSIIIGFTGSISSGCTLFAKKLNEIAGYHYYSLSKPIHKIAETQLKENQVKEITQELLQDIGNKLRKEKGSHYLAKKALNEIDKNSEPNKEYKVVIDSIRNDWEVKFFRQFPNFFLVSVFSDRDIRYNRWLKQNPTCSTTEFENVDLRDAAEGFEYGQQVEKCTYASDIVINNDKETEIGNPKAEKDHVKDKFKKYLTLIEQGPSVYERPGVHEKLMTLAYQESLSSSCLQRKVGAVIATEDGEIISTGFNHVPLEEEICSDKYGECYRNYLKKAHAKLIKHCPKCGEKIIIKCPKCGEDIEGYNFKCPNCDNAIKFDYVCKNQQCGVKVFDLFLPGGKEAPGKLLDVCRALHAEENAIVSVAKIGNISLKDKTLYSTTFPCKLCANKIAQVGIKKVVYSEPYTMPDAQEVLKNNDVEIVKFEGVKSSAFFRLYGY